METLYIKFKSYLFWGAALRFIFEAYLELVLCILIGLSKMRWVKGDFSIFYNNLFTIGVAIVVFIMPFFTSVFYGWNIDKMDEVEFKRRFGTLYQGLNLDMEEGKRKSGLFFPFFFVIRRIAFVGAAIWLAHFLWSQLAIQFFCSVTMIIYLFHYWPFDKPIFTMLEIMNEITSILLLYHMFCFTDWVPEAETRYLMGWSFIGITCSNLVLHVVMLCFNSTLNLKQRCLRLCTAKAKGKEEIKKKKSVLGKEYLE